MKVYKAKKDYYCRCYDSRTGKTTLVHGATQSEARRNAVLHQMRVEERRDEIEFGEAFSDFVENRTSLSASTLRCYHAMFENHLQDIKNIPLSSLDNRIVQKLLDRKATDHSPKSVSNMYGLICAVTTYAMPGKKFDVRLPQKVKRKVSLPTQSEIAELISEARCNDERMIIELALYAGLRCSEIAALRKSDLDKDDVLHITKAQVREKGGNFVLKPPKTECGYREVSIPKSLAERIRKGNDKVVSFNADQVSQRFRYIKKKCHVDCSMHRLRHYSASYLSAYGNVSDAEILERFGWSSTDMFKVYVHDLKEDRARKSAEKMARDLERKLKIN